MNRAVMGGLNPSRRTCGPNSTFRKESEAIEPELEWARKLIAVRVKAGLSQSDVAVRMGTSQPTVARLESGHKPSLRTLERYAEAVGLNVEIRLVAG